MIRPLEPCDLHARLAAGEELQLVDVREDEEITLARFAGALHMRRSEGSSGGSLHG